MKIPQPVPVPTPTKNNYLIMNNGTVIYKDSKNIYPIACQADGGILYSDSSTVYSCENIISSNAPMKHQAQVSLDFVIGMGLVVIAVLALIYSLITYLLKKQ